MDRRDFIRTTGSVIAGATLAHKAFGESVAQASSASGARIILPINRNWKYNPSFVEGGHEKGFDDAAFTSVVVPHTNIKLP